MKNNEFCRFFRNGLSYKNNTYNFTASPCCYYQYVNELDPDKNLAEQLNTFRSGWQNDQILSSCQQCINLENSGIPSFRQASFDTCEGSTDGIEFLTVAVNKQCNLACASCDSGSSSFWHQENTRNNIKEPERIIQLHKEDKQGQVTERFIELLSQQDLSNLKYLKFGGGEPLMSSIHTRIIDLVPSPQNVILHYTSNFSIMPSDLAMKSWKKFKLVKWVASVDGVENQFEILRWPYQWNKFEKFCVQALNVVPDNVMFGVEHTVNPLNVFYYDRFEQWFKQNFSHNRYGDQSDLNLHVCQNKLGLEQTPISLRKKITEKYGNNHPITLMLDQTPQSNSYKTLVNHMNMLDQQRGTNWRTTFKEVENYFK